MGDFIPLFLVRFPYNYLRQNERFKLYIIRGIVKRGFWSKTSSFGALLLCASPFMQDYEVQRLQFHNLLHIRSMHLEKIL